MKRFLVLFLGIITLVWVESCMPLPQTNDSVKLSAKLIAPIASDSLIYNDDNVGLVFAFSNKEIAFILRNNTESTIKVLWDESAVVIDGMTQRIGHKNIKYADMASSHPPTVIPPLASTSDVLIPIENINYNTTVGWVTKNMFEKSKGFYRVGVLLGLSIDGKLKEYYFKFDVSFSDIKSDPSYTTVKLKNTYENLYISRSSKSNTQTWDLVEALLKSKGFEVDTRNRDKNIMLVTNKKLKGAYSAEKGEGQLTSYDKFVVVTRCYSKESKSYIAVSDLKATWQVEVGSDNKGVFVRTRMETYTITRMDKGDEVCADAEVRSTGLLEKQIGAAVR